MDDATFIQMCTESTTTFYRVAVSILRKQHDAEDAVQQALMKGWTSRKRIWKGSEQAWMMRVVINEWKSICQGVFYPFLKKREVAIVAHLSFCVMS